MRVLDDSRGWHGELQCAQQRLLYGVDLRQSTDLSTVLGLGRLMLNPSELLQESGGGFIALTGLQAHAHHPVEHQRHKAHHGVSANSLGQPVVQGAISKPAVENYVRRLEADEVAPAIKADGKVIVDGNHRYVAGRLVGK